MDISVSFRFSALRALRPRHACVGMLVLVHCSAFADRARADTQPLYYESATMGPAAVPGPGLPISENAFNLARIHLDETVEVSGIGGHLIQDIPCPWGCNSLMWGGIVALDGPDAFPHGDPLLDMEVLAETTFNAGNPSNDALAPLSAMLDPGDYGIVFGTRRLDALGGGLLMTNNPTLPGGSYARWTDPGGWQNLDYSAGVSPRFTLYGTRVPEPCTLSLLALGVFLSKRRRVTQQA